MTAYHNHQSILYCISPPNNHSYHRDDRNNNSTYQILHHYQDIYFRINRIEHYDPTTRQSLTRQSSKA